MAEGGRDSGVAPLGASAVCAGLAASSVNSYTHDVRAQVGPLTRVVAATADLRPGTAITAETAARSMEIRRVPIRYAPPRALGSAAEAIGFRLAARIGRGDYVTRSTLVPADAKGAGGGGGRIVEVAVAGAGSLADSLQSGARVDVLITTDRGSGPGRTYLATQDAELVAFSPSSGGSGETGRATAALRVSLRQAVMLTAAQNFARELRLVPRPEGDRRTFGTVGSSADEFAR